MGSTEFLSFKLNAQKIQTVVEVPTLDLDLF